MQSRYYNPEWDRFINADSLAGQVGELLGHNIFAYCKNNPINMKDNNGFRSTPAWGDDEYSSSSSSSDSRKIKINPVAAIVITVAMGGIINYALKHPNVAKAAGAGSLAIEAGGSFSESEIRAAEYMKNLGNEVILRTPQGTRAAGGTSDLLVNGVPYDVYTPLTNNASRIISGIAAKKDQAVGIVLDLSRTNVTPEELGDVMARLAGKGVTTIKDVVIFK